MKPTFCGPERSTGYERKKGQGRGAGSLGGANHAKNPVCRPVSSQLVAAGERLHDNGKTDFCSVATPVWRGQGPFAVPRP
jgi:hypothetical protein